MYTLIGEADWQRVAACLTVQTVPAGTCLVEAGRVCRHLYFLERGLLRFFVWKQGVAARLIGPHEDDFFSIL